LTSARNAARLFAQTLPAQTVEPWRELARHPNPAADIGGRNRPRGNERLNLAGVASKSAIRFSERSEPAAHRVRMAAVTSGPQQCRPSRAATIQEDVDARIAAGSGLTEHPWSVFSDP
jgi:hypothetical protein